VYFVERERSLHPSYPISEPNKDGTMCALCLVVRPLADMTLTIEGRHTDVCKICLSFDNHLMLQRKICDIVLNALNRQKNGEQALVKLARESAAQIERLLIEHPGS
jgi:hypothetical protein